MDPYRGKEIKPEITKGGSDGQLLITDQIHQLILEDSRISAKSTVEQLGISRERVGSIIHEDLDMRKLYAKWVPKCLNADQKHQRCQWSEQHLEFFGAIQMISCRGW